MTHKSEQHNTLMGEIVDFVVPKVHAMGNPADQLVLCETIIAMLCWAVGNRTEALAIFEILKEGVETRLKQKMD